MRWWDRLRGALRRVFAPVPPAPRPEPPAAPRERPGRRPRHRPREAVLQLGRPSPHSRALFPPEIQRLLAAALQVWPDEPYFTVAVFARYRVTDPDSPTGSGQLVGKAYGHPLRPLQGRLYWGWRAESMSRRQLEEFGSMIVPGLLETYGGVRPVRAVAVRPTDPTR